MAGCGKESQFKKHPTRPRATLTVCVAHVGGVDGLERTLESATPLADEIVVVSDTGSRADARVPIPCRSVRVAWKRDFSGLRNSALAQATGDWVLFLDAGEWLSAEAVDAIREAILSAVADGFLLLLSSVAGGPGMNECFIQRQCRLFRRVPGIEFHGRAADSVEAEIRDGGGRIAELGGELIQRDAHRLPDGTLSPATALRIAILEEVAAAEPYDTHARYQLGLEHYALGDFESAREHLSAACEGVCPSAHFASMAYSLLTIALRETGRPAMGVASAEWAERLGLHSAELSFARGWAHMALSEFPEAALHFETALKLAGVPGESVDPSIPRYRGAMALALALIESGSPGAAVAPALSAVQGCPDRPEPRVLLACAHHLQGDKELALSRLEEALGLDPDHPDALGLAAPLFQQAGQHERALQAVDRLLRRHPDAPDVVLTRAAVLRETGRSAEALGEARRACEMGKHSSDIQIDAGRLLAACGDYRGARECFRRAMLTNPKDASAHIEAGDVCFTMGCYDEAAMLYERATQMDPGNAVALFALGNSLIKCGRLQAAVRAWEQVLEIRPDFRDAAHNLRIARTALERAA